MGREELELLRGGIVKRKTKRHIGLFIDATGLDRATRRLDRKVDLASLVKGLTSGLKIEIARYYSLIPYEDDARQFAFLDAVERAGVEVITKRLPPKGVKRQVSMDVHIAADMISYAYGHFAEKAQEVESKAVANGNGGIVSSTNTLVTPPTGITQSNEPVKTETPREIRRVLTCVCPSRELSYALFMANKLGVETSLADFGLYGTSDGWKGVDRWVDLSTSETIWRG
ncbi:MAG: NYN domain-containing protein [Bdellovibrionota bacterium]